MIRLTWMSINRAQFSNLPETHGKHMPLERALLIGMLEADKLYGPADVAAIGFERGTKDYERARKAFWNFARLNDIKLNYDNIEKESGEPPQWCGSSWQDALGWRMNEVAKVMDKLERKISTNPGCSFFYHDNEIISIYSPSKVSEEKDNIIMTLPCLDDRNELIRVRRPIRQRAKKKTRLKVKILASSFTLIFILLSIVFYQNAKFNYNQNQNKAKQEVSFGSPVSVGVLGEAP